MPLLPLNLGSPDSSVEDDVQVQILVRSQSCPENDHFLVQTMKNGSFKKILTPCGAVMKPLKFNFQKPHWHRNFG